MGGMICLFGCLGGSLRAGWWGCGGWPGWWGWGGVVRRWGRGGGVVAGGVVAGWTFVRFCGGGEVRGACGAGQFADYSVYGRSGVGCAGRGGYSFAASGGGCGGVVAGWHADSLRV